MPSVWRTRMGRGWKPGTLWFVTEGGGARTLRGCFVLGCWGQGSFWFVVEGVGATALTGSLELDCCGPGLLWNRSIGGCVSRALRGSCLSFIETAEDELWE